jgi:hypothetical protein
MKQREICAEINFHLTKTKERQEIVILNCADPKIVLPMRQLDGSGLLCWLCITDKILEITSYYWNSRNGADTIMHTVNLLHHSEHLTQMEPVYKKILDFICRNGSIELISLS